MMVVAIPLHGSSTGAATVIPPLVVIVAVLAGIGTAGILGLALAAYVRRRSRSYLLVVLAIVALLGRSLTTVYTYFPGGISSQGHHLIEHAFDLLMVTLVFAAVYYARSVAPAAEVES